MSLSLKLRSRIKPHEYKIKYVYDYTFSINKFEISQLKVSLLQILFINMLR